MLIAIDIRNKVISVGFHEEGAWRAIRRIGALNQRTSDEYSMLFRHFLLEMPEAGGMSFSAPALTASFIATAPAVKADSVWISSVVPSLTPLLTASAKEVFGCEVHVVGPGVKTGIKIRTDLPSELGSDLVCAAAAGRDLTRSAFIVVDFGVAITFSAVNQAGEFLGAAIVPGPETCAETLRLQAVQIPEVKLEFPSRSIGRSTGESVRSGILLGYEGLILHMLETMTEEMQALGASAVVVYGTGDEIGREFLKRSGRGSFVPNLALEGLASIAKKSIPA
ncbi:MAG TPA: type III pantothenate kinase [Rectinemataceae bacterium]|nr:type III pantothenate kinase [Rectinemataceae bacterium]